MLFKYLYVGWAEPWPEPVLRLHWLLMAVAAACIMVGYRYRIASVFFCLSFTYMFWLDETQYLNHFYMVILFSVLMIFLPANAYWSLDAKRNPSIASNTVPHWTRIILLGQLEIILLYAGLVKVNSDWLNLEPMRLWMNYKSQSHGEFLQFLTQDWGIALACYGVIALHLVGAPLLFSNRYRIPVLCCYAVFHTINAFVFNIGIFPWFTLFASLLFFQPDWPKTFWTKLQLRFPAVQKRFTSQPISYATTYHGQSQLRRADHVIAFAVVAWLRAQIQLAYDAKIKKRHSQIYNQGCRWSSLDSRWLRGLNCGSAPQNVVCTGYDLAVCATSRTARARSGTPRSCCLRHGLDRNQSIRAGQQLGIASN